MYFLHISWLFDFGLGPVTGFGQGIWSDLTCACRIRFPPLTSAFCHEKSDSSDATGPRRMRDTWIKSGAHPQPGSKLSQTQFRLFEHLFSCWCVREKINLYCCLSQRFYWEEVVSQQYWLKYPCNKFYFKHHPQE